MTYLCSRLKADVAELVDASDLGSGAARRGGSSPFIRTKISLKLISGFGFFLFSVHIFIKITTLCPKMLTKLLTLLKQT